MQTRGIASRSPSSLAYRITGRARAASAAPRPASTRNSVSQATITIANLRAISSSSPLGGTCPSSVAFGAIDVSTVSNTACTSALSAAPASPSVTAASETSVTSPVSL